MNKDTLFLIRSQFYDGEKGPYFCPECVQMLGLLETYPELKDKVEIHYVDFKRPRPAIIPLIGEENQGCPVLVLKESGDHLPVDLHIKKANGHSFVDGANAISSYLAHVYKTGIPH